LGNTIYVGDNHAESQTTAITINPTGSAATISRVLCHNHSGSYPPASTDLTTGATISTTAASVNLTYSGIGGFYFYGLSLRAGVGVSTAVNSMLLTPSSGSFVIFDNCSFWLSNSTANNVSQMQIGASGAAATTMIFNNCTVRFAVVTQFISTGNGVFVWQNTGAILASGSSVPNNLFSFAGASAGTACQVILEALDLSQLTGGLYSTTTALTSLLVKDCVFNVSMTSATPSLAGAAVQYVRSDDLATAYQSNRFTVDGTETTETSIVRVGGSVDPTGQAQSRKIVTTANSQWLRPFRAEPYAIWNSTTGANVTVTVCGTVNAGALPNNDDIWLEVEYLGSSASPLGTMITTTKANLLAANAAVASDGSTWNNTLYNTFDGVPSAGVVVSNGNLTVTHGTNNTGVGVNSTAFLVAGKWYFEVTLQGVVNGGDALGIMLSTGTFNNVVSGTNSTVVLLGGTSNVWSNNANTSMNLGSPSVGDVFGVAIDLNAKLAWFRRNNGNWNASGTANPATGTGGATIAGGAFAPVVAFISGATTDAMTANFGQSAYSGTPPSGFANWNGWSPFKLTVTLSAPQPGMAGYLHARVRAAKPSSTFYIDPQITLTPAGGGSTNVGTAYTSSRYAYEGTETTETSITRVGGASDPTGQAQSRKIVTTANSQWLRPFKAEPYAIWNPTTGANVTVTVYGTINAGALPNNDDIWLEVEYLGSSSSPLGTLVTTTKANVLAANAAVALDSSTWNNTPNTFDPVTAVNTTLSNGNLTATHNTATGASGARVSGGTASGKYYFEITQTTLGHGNLDGWGLMSPTGVFTDLSTGVNGITVTKAGQCNINNIVVLPSNTLGAVLAGDVIGFALDFGALLCWVRRNNGNWNGSGTANPATAVGGLSFPSGWTLTPGVAFSGSGSAIGDSDTINLGATSYANAAPSGFGNWIAWTPFKLTATLSAPQPGMAGYLHARVRAAKPSSTYYIDPQITLS
jgi:hypothetical protein